MGMEYHDTAAYEPIGPEELCRLQAVFETARDLTSISAHDPAAERLAAMAIRFYQLGIRDDEMLVQTIVQTNRTLRQA